MPHLTQKLATGPFTCNCGPNTIIGGRLVMPDTVNLGMVIHTTLATTKCLGVALDDAIPLSGQTVDGYAVTAAIIRSEFAVAWEGIYWLDFSVAATFGDLLVADAAGKVRPYTAGTSTYDQIIGRCVEPKNVLINTRGRVRLAIY